MKRIVLALAAVAALGVWAKSATAEKIAAKYRVTGSDRWYGGERTLFEFNGCETWVVEPDRPAAGNPWAWIMEWPGAFAKRTGAPALLAAGYRVVTFRPGFYKDGKFVSKPGNMNDARLKESRAFQRMLVEELGFAAKGNLIGMSWGGFYSIRYASTYPECVAHIYLDAPLLDFSTLQNWAGWNVAGFYGVDAKTYVGANDPMQPVNRAEPIAKAGIPILLLYGGADAVVPPGPNCELFAKRFKDFGGVIRVQRRGGYGHHPHGLEVDEQQQFVDFFNGR
ncbi:MAG: alpha/beta hydrolase [Kiritimatiellia bacterium]